MRRIALTVTALALAGNLFAQSGQSGPYLSGSVTGGYANNNLLDNPFIESVPGFSSELTTTLVEIRLSSSKLQAGKDATLFKGDLSRSDRIGYDIGVSLDMTKLLDYSDSTSRYDFSSDTSGYPMLQRMIDWYANNHRRYNLAKFPDGAASWPTTSYGSSAGRYPFISGWTVEPIEWVTWSEEKWADARALYLEVKDKILNEIEDISPDVTTGGGDHINQFTYNTLSHARQQAVLKEQKAHDDFMEYVFGEDDSLEMNGVKIQKAWAEFSNIAGLLSIRADLTGASFSTGTTVRSSRATQEESGSALAVGLMPNLIPGLSARLSADISGGLSSIAEDYDTQTLEYADGEEAWVGVLGEATYNLDWLLGRDAAVSLALLFPDIIQRPDCLSSSLGASWREGGFVSWNARGELNLLSWNDRYLDDDATTAALAGAVDGEVSCLGAGVKLKSALKQDGYGGWGGNDEEDSFAAESLWDDFESAKNADALALDIGLFYEPALLLSRDIGRIGGGYRVLRYGNILSDEQGRGWYTTIELRLKDVSGLPLVLKGEISRWENDGLVAWTDESSWPHENYLKDMTFTASAIFTPTANIAISVAYEDRHSGYTGDTSRLRSLGTFLKVGL